MAKNSARDLLYPVDPNILVRVAFLYVGQGSSAIVFIADGAAYKVLLVDINLDKKAGGIDVPKFMTDLLNGENLEAFVNTHPHDDHLCGTKELSAVVTINNVWHSDHKPSKKYGSKDPELTDLIKKVKDAGGEEIIIEAADNSSALGEAEYHFLSPKEHVKDDVNEDEADQRRQRIHEMCGVIKFGKGDNWILISGDADLRAFREHIMKTHKEFLPDFALGASHHGSRSFFVENEKEDPYLEALQAITPKYIVVSAPLQTESKHEHPHDDAMGWYEGEVGKDNVLHSGEERCTYFFDIYRDGSHGQIQHDEGRLAVDYGLEDDGDGDDGSKSSAVSVGPFATTPRSGAGEYQPRKFG